MSWKRKNSM